MEYLAQQAETAQEVEAREGLQQKREYIIFSSHSFFSNTPRCLVKLWNILRARDK